MPRALPGLRKAHPELRLHLREDLTASLMASCARAPRCGADRLSQNVGDCDSEVIGDDRLLLALPGDHALSRGHAAGRAAAPAQRALAAA
ncbi:MAG: hypothetical protein HPM95_20790 [Alphaproteobacteria bacterium]|nr:hypothetical protein [Alphaproteobacteria bacterium]